MKAQVCSSKLRKAISIDLPCLVLRPLDRAVNNTEKRLQRAEELARYLRREEEALSCLGLLGTLEPAGPPIYRESRRRGHQERKRKSAQQGGGGVISCVGPLDLYDYTMTCRAVLALPPLLLAPRRESETLRS